MHWIDKLAEKLAEKYAGKEEIVINSGLSVSGLQHIGRLRGEVLIGEALRRELRKRGFNVKQYIVLYTQDAWKGKEAQLKAFKNEKEALRFVGWPLINVPDPEGCHENWVEHYWSDFGGYLDKFTDGEIEVVTTTELYKNELKKVVLECIRRRDEVRRVINKYRGRKPYPENWIPFEPVCGNCGRIDTTEAIEFNEDKMTVKYRCRNCGYIGETDISNGKLNWRLEWVGVWISLRVDFEPYGKDHATPGGSRDSCNEIARVIFGVEPPEGIPYEWVAIRLDGRESDMSSSDFIGVTPREWYEVAHPEVLRYIYYVQEPRKKIVIDMSMIPSYYREYYDAENKFYIEKESKEEYSVEARSYILAQIRDPPEKKPIQVWYETIALIVQSIPEDTPIDNVVKRLRSSRIIAPSEKLSEYDFRRIRELVEKARVWVKKYAPSSLRYNILDKLSSELVRKLEFRNELVSLGKKLLELDEWSSERIKEVMIKHTEGMSKSERRRFYSEFYKIITGEPRGPRAAPLLEALGKEFVAKRLVEDLEKIEE